MYRHTLFTALRYAAFLTAGVAFTACINDETQLGGNTITQLSLAPTPSTNQTLNIDFGDSCIIAPTFVQTGGNSQPLSCTWSVGTYDPATQTKGTLTPVAKGERFSHLFDKGGTYYVHLNATNGTTGLAQDYLVNVNRSFERGILITAIDADGSGNLGFVKSITHEDSLAGKTAYLREHCLEILNPGITTKGLLGTSVVIAPTGSTKKMIVALEDRSYFVDPSTFELQQTLRYEDVYPDFRATHFSAQASSASYPYVYDKAKRKYVHLERDFAYPYQHASYFYNNQAFEDIFTQVRPSLNGRDLQNPVDLFVNYAESEVAEYSGYTSTLFGQKKSTGDLLKDQNILSVFRRKLSGAAAPTYVLTQPKNAATTVRLYTLVDSTAGAYGNATNPYRELYKSSFVEQSGVPADIIPAQGTRLVEARNANVVFYAIGGRLYSYYAFNTAPTLPTTPTLSFEGESITALGINEESQELYVGTYNAQTQRGSLRVYDATNLRSGVQPRIYLPNSTGRIVELRYKS